MTIEPSFDDLFQWDRQYVWHPFTQMGDYHRQDQLMIVGGRGPYLIDEQGREYIDGVSSLWCNLFGHCHPAIDRAIRQQLDQLAHSTLLGPTHPGAAELAKRLVDLTPAGLNHIFFSDNGSTAVEAALKIAYQYWQQRPAPRPQKRRFVSQEGAYHGDTLGSVSVGGIELFHELYRPILLDTLHVPSARLYRNPLGDHPATICQAALDRLEDVLRERSDEIVGLVLEPLVQGADGIYTQAPGYLAGARELTRKYHVLLIVDEVATGFGRTGRMFACEHEQVRPDLMCLAKGITGGYLPLAATLATDEIYRAFLGEYRELKTFFHGHTYTGNPLAAAAALATLRVFEDEDILGGLPLRIERLAEWLDRMNRLEHVGDVRQIGLMAGLELVRDKTTADPYPWQEQRGIQVCQQARLQGVLIRPLGNVIVLMPSLNISLEVLDRLCEVAMDCIQQVTDK